MHRYVISPATERDIQAILSWTHERFGQRGRLRYESLLVRAIQDVAENPKRIDSRSRSEIAMDSRTYPLWHSRNRVVPAKERVHRPRHFLLYRIRGNGQVEIGRVLHDCMDMVRHLPEDFS
jgi:toxin ParE1/3/4